MAMLTVYADESGTDGSSPMVADGYVCTVELWDDFQVEWIAFMDQDVKAEFHTTHCPTGRFCGT